MGEKEWLSVKEFAEMEGISERAVRLRKERGVIKKFRYIKSNSGGGKKGEALEIHCSELSPKGEEKFFADSQNDKAPSVPDYLPGTLSGQGQEIVAAAPALTPSAESENLEVKNVGSAMTDKTIVPGAAKSIALARMDLLKAWADYRQHLTIVDSSQFTEQQILFNSKKRLSEINKEFEKGYNTGVLFPYIYKVLGEVDIQTLYRWQRNLDGTQDWARLIPGWWNGKGEPYLTPEEKNLFRDLLLQPNKMHIGEAASVTKTILKISSPSSKMTFRRWAEWFKTKNNHIWVLMREGQQALRDKVLFYIKRDISKLEVGDVLVADGHRLNFRVINPFTGKPCRATLVGYLDWKSWNLAGYEIMIEENTQCIASALRNSIINLGRVPKISYQDNGKAFRARFFTSTQNFEEAGFYGLFGRLGIIPVFAMPYNARAKVIERFFREFTGKFERLMPSFTGASIEDKPAWTKAGEKMHKILHNDYVPTIEETVGLINIWLRDYYQEQECPHVKGKTIKEVFESGALPTGQAGSEPEINIQELDDLLMAVEIKTIGRNGIRFLGADYYDDTLFGLKERVIIKYSLTDLSHVKVYDLNGAFFCTAKRVMPVHPMAEYLGDIKDMAEFKHRISHQRGLERDVLKIARRMIIKNKKIELPWADVINAAPGVVKKLEELNISLPAPETRIPEEAVCKSSEPYLPSGRSGACLPDRQVRRLEQQIEKPIFQEMWQRYEYLQQQGKLTEEEQQWISWYTKTNEYGLIYGESA